MAYFVDGTVRDVDGVPVSDALVYVYSPDGSLASLYDSLSVPLLNPVQTNDAGYWAANALDDGYYTIRINYGGRERKVYEVLLGTEPIAKADGIATALVTYTFGYIGIDNPAPPSDIGTGDGYVYTNNARVYGAVKVGPSTGQDKFEILTVAALGSMDGSTLGYEQGGEGAILQNVQTVLRRTVSPEDYGAKFDGTTNDAPAFNRAIAYLSSGGGGTLRLPPKDALLASDVIISGNGIVIEGSSHGSSRIINGRANTPAIQFGDGVNIGYRNGISNVVLAQKAGIPPSLGNCGVLLIKQSNFISSNIQSFQFPAPLYDGMVLDQVTQSYLDGFGLQNSINRNLAITNQCVDITATNGRCDGGNMGVEFRDVQGMHFVNWTCYGNRKHGWNLVTDFPSGSFNNRFFYFTNCVGDTSGSHNWNIEQCSVGMFTACWASTQLSAGQISDLAVEYPGLTQDLLADGFHIQGTDAESLVFSSCFAISNNRHGAAVWEGRSLHFASCMLGSNFAPEDYGGAGANNGKGGAGSGLYVGAGASFVSGSGGHYEHNTSYGVDVASGAQECTFSNIELRFNLTQQVRNLANSSSMEAKFVNCSGYNPVGYISPMPAVPASGVEVYNLSGVDANVYIQGGTVSNIEINGQGVFAVSNVSVFLAAGDRIRMTYTSAPTWQWRGN